MTTGTLFKIGLVSLALAGCATASQPPAATSQKLDSGVTSSSGGAMPNSTAPISTKAY